MAILWRNGSVFQPCRTRPSTFGPVPTSATGLAFGLLLDDSLHHKLPHDLQVSLDTPVYDLVPEGRPLTDPDKQKIQLRHLLTMTSGIPGESRGVMGLAVAPRSGEYEFALGKEPNRFGISAAKLAGEPGTVWDYSDAAFAHLSLFFADAEGREVGDYMKERVFDPIGMEDVSWDRQGGSGHIGPHTNAHSGLHSSARDFARLGYLLAHDGQWRDKQIVPRSWIQTATQSSQTKPQLWVYLLGEYRRRALAYCAEGRLRLQRIRRQSLLRRSLAGFGGGEGRRCTSKLGRGVIAPGSHGGRSQSSVVRVDS